MSGNLLESFYILFSSDADDVKEGAEDAGKSTDKLDKKLKETDRSAKKTGDSFAAMASRAAAFLAPLIGLSAMKGAVVDFAAGADAAGTLAETLRMNVEELQAWQGAAARTGGSAEGLAGSAKNLNAALHDMGRGVGTEAGLTLRRLGISAREADGSLKTADKTLLELTDKFQGLSRERAMRLGEKLGLDEGTILLLMQGKKGVEDLLARQKELGLYSKKQAEDAKKFNNSWADMRQAFWSVAGVVISAVLPMFTAISGGLTTAALNVRRHKDLITGFFIALSVIMGVLAIKTGLAFAPFLLFAAIILALAGAFAVAYDDVQNFLGGHDSMIGRLSKDYPWLADLVLDVVDTLERLWRIAKAVGTLLVESIEDPQAAWENFMAAVMPDVDALSEKFPELSQVIKDVGAIIKWLFDLAVPLLKMLLGIVTEILGFIFDKLGKVMGLLGKAVGWVASKVRGDSGKEPEEDFNLDEYLEDKNDGADKSKTRRHPVDDWPDDFSMRAEPPPLTHTPWSPPPETEVSIQRGKTALAQTNTPLAAQSSGRPKEVKVEKTYHISVDKVEVVTQGTDADGIAGGIGDALSRELRSAIDNFDDGVAA
jgi:hypothetical protein